MARRVGVAGVLMTLAWGGFAASAAVADRRPQPNADELWRSYPLEQKPTATAPAPAAAPAAAPRRAATPATHEARDSGPPWAVLVAIGAAFAIVAFVAARRLRRAPPASDAALGGPQAPSLEPSSAARETPAAPRAAVGPPGAARAAAAASAAVVSRPARGQAPAAAPRPVPAPATNGLARSASRATVCQIRWSRRAKRFFAVTVDAEGGEKRVGRSPLVDWPHAGPPEETPEAQAALRQVVKDLRARDWRPLRARGIDFDERQWYARRFRRPTEAELGREPRQPVGETPNPEVAARPGEPR